MGACATATEAIDEAYRLTQDHSLDKRWSILWHRGVILMRKRMLEEAQTVANGGEPKAIIRDPEQNRKLYLPRVERDLRNQIANGQTRAPRNQHLAGQPQVILDEMDRIWTERSQGSTIGNAHKGSTGS